MKIPLSTVSDDGFKLDFNESNEEIKEALEGKFAGNAFKGDLEIRPTGEHFHMRGHIAGDVNLECSFCTETFRHPINESFQEILAPKWQNKMMQSHSVKDFLESEVELITGLHEEEFDFGEYLHEVIEFALPSHPKCVDACKGLCASCGKNLNEGSCECSNNKQSGHIAFSALKDLKIDKKH